MVRKRKAHHAPSTQNHAVVDASSVQDTGKQLYKILVFAPNQQEADACAAAVAKSGDCTAIGLAFEKFTQDDIVPGSKIPKRESYIRFIESICRPIDEHKPNAVITTGAIDPEVSNSIAPGKLAAEHARDKDQGNKPALYLDPKDWSLERISSEAKDIIAALKDQRRGREL